MKTKVILFVILIFTGIQAFPFPGLAKTVSSATKVHASNDANTNQPVAARSPASDNEVPDSTSDSINTESSTQGGPAGGSLATGVTSNTSSSAQ